MNQDSMNPAEDARETLLGALVERLEKSEHEVAHAAVEWLEVETAPAASAELRSGFMLRAVSEVWRRERLRLLYAEVRNGAVDVRDRTVLFLALATCDPKDIPSFGEWLEERRAAKIG